MLRAKRPTLFIAILLLGSPAGLLYADETAPTRNRFEFAFGAFEPNVETIVRLDSTSGDFGTEISLENDLAFEDRKTLPIIYFRWNMKKRMGLEASYYSLDRDSTVVLGKEIKFGDETFPVNSTVNSTFVTDVFRLSYVHDVVQKEKDTLSLIGGIHFTSFEASINDSLLGLNDGNDGLAPLPMLGLRYQHRFSDRWSMGIRAEFLDQEYDGTDGKIENFAWHGVYKFRKKWAFLFGYSLYDLEVSEEAGGFRGSITYRYKGPSISLAAGF